MPYGANAGEIDNPAPNSGPGGRLSNFLTVPHFWRVTLSFGLWWFAGAIVYIQIAPFLVEKGFTTASAATSVIVFGAANCLGRIAFGWLSDRIGSVWSYRAAVLTCAAASSGFAANDKTTVIAVIVGLLGFGIDGVSAELIAVSVDLFGTRAARIMMGTVLALMGISAAGEPLASGYVFDAVQSYGLAFYGGGAVFLLALLFTGGLSARRG